MFKKSRILGLGLLMSVSTLSADDQTSTTKELTEVNLYSGGFVTGLGLTTLETIPFFGGNAGTVLQFGYYGTCWMFDVGANYGNQRRSHATFVSGHLGLRNRLYQNLFISYGAMGLGNFVSEFRKQWSVGAFTGFDYQFSKHFLLSAKVYPYNYDHRFARFTNNVFANSTISLLYVF